MNFKKNILQSIVFLLIIIGLTQSAEQPGFYVKDGNILESNGSLFIMRGINYPYTWYTTQFSSEISKIAQTGANCVRVVMSTGDRWTKTNSSAVDNIISTCKKNKLIAILEVHDVTGYAEQAGSVPLTKAVNYWIEMKNSLIGQEKNVIINIANEPFGNDGKDEDWANGHITAIKSLRNAGLKHMFIADAANWGQDWKGTTKTSAKKVLDADTLNNTIIAIHMYDVYKNDTIVNAYLKTFYDKKLPLIVGEFAEDHGTKGPVAAQAILDRCKQYGMGYIGWSWCGNSSDLSTLDMTNSACNGSSYSKWGNLLITGTNGIKETSILASVYTGKIIAPTKVFKQNGKMNTQALQLRLIGSDLNLVFPGQKQGLVKLEIFNLEGKTIRRCNLSLSASGEANLNLGNNDLSGGTYGIRVSLAKKVIAQTRVVFAGGR